MRDYSISVGKSRFETNWLHQVISWRDLQQRLLQVHRSAETYQQYLHAPKDEQSRLKDIGGFVGGTLLDGRRGSDHVTGRDLITLDLDNINAATAEDVNDQVERLGISYIIYSTRKHSPEKPRLRVIIPLDRAATTDEYEPVARKLASLIGMEWCDPTTFQASRLMYWPSVSSDGEFYYRTSEKEVECSVDAVLAMYHDWRDVTEWPIVSSETVKRSKELKHQEDPRQKSGIVGYFCQSYDIYEAIEKFLPGVYTESDKDDRLTYVGGSTAGGAIVYQNGLFLYSHHATDPCSMMLVNSFDLVRMHKFSHLDEDADPSAKSTSLPSYKAMVKLCNSDQKVQLLKAKDEQQKAMDAFKAPAETVVVPPEATDEDAAVAWRTTLDKSDNGATLSTIQNVGAIVANDPNLRGRIWYDDFAERIMVSTPVPWDMMSNEVRPWNDVDDTGLMWHIERTYTKKISQQKCVMGLNLAAAQRKVNPVKEYLESVRWDGVPRVDELLIKYLGALDTPYTRAVTRKMMVAAVARALAPGVKFDNMLILVGDQGLGKSTLFRKLGKQWFTDSLTTFEGKEAAETIQGAWIIEVGELTAMTRQESNSVKQFLSKQDDKYRAAYGRRTETHKRKCIFVGTSNDYEFLKDPTGNRRFWPVNVGRIHTGLNVFNDLTDSVINSIWAEAIAYYRLGESLYLERDIEALAMEEQKEHLILSGKEGIIEDYLDMPVPERWLDMSDMERRQFLNGNLHADGTLTIRKQVCPLEIWLYCYEKPIGQMQRADVTEIGRIMKLLGWSPTKSAVRFGNFGRCRGYERV